MSEARSLMRGTAVSSLDMWQLIYIIAPKILVNASTNTTNWFICYEPFSTTHGQIINFIMRYYFTRCLSNFLSSASVKLWTWKDITVGKKPCRKIRDLNRWLMGKWQTRKSPGGTSIYQRRTVCIPFCGPWFSIMWSCKIFSLLFL
jgi:hypothetical protein